MSEIYRDVLSRVGQLCGNEDMVSFTDAINIINDAIRSLRVQYVKAGIIEDFLVTDTVWVTIDDFEYPFLYKGDICQPIMNEVPIGLAIQSSVVWKTENELKNQAQSWTQGDLVFKDNVVYKATEDISSTNTYDRTFEFENVRTYRDNNGLNFKKGDVVKNYSDGTYWRCTSDYVANQSESISSSGSFEQLYWKSVDDAYLEASYVEWGSIHQMKLFENIDYQPFTIKNCKLYTTKKNVPITLTYIPKWKKVEDLEESVLLPDSLIAKAKQLSIVKLAQKLGVEVEDNAK